ncbi:conserved hypothetical protein [Neospora caninum Liverpool]|uniref:SAG-related sequence SRS67 n=1 Tax=Neospora caninum (strain Liverpool) TaxID=572307 RepID=F0VLQ4_NEOCL|nr:conserved hypothetical protein [Neospora caninum Liverpool]CBZ54182.1 conserved hypothetical protein [Neospora caninum Liverpool]CEL68883.1 TPA: SAG-related sequence SRS67 [Neospora caninum Liverpool]|eukprot:XP_003884213.1 conserved hypothetical protein [Neospora caninum Liverpool]
MACRGTLSVRQWAVSLCIFVALAGESRFCTGAQGTVFDAVIDVEHPKHLSVSMRYGDQMRFFCKGATAIIPQAFKSKCCNAYRAICTPGNIESEYSGMFPLADEGFSFWSAGDGVNAAAMFTLPPQKNGNRYETRFSLGCVGARNQVSAVDVTIAASGYNLREHFEDAMKKPVHDEEEKNPQTVTESGVGADVLSPLGLLVSILTLASVSQTL